MTDARHLPLIHVVWAWAPSDPIAEKWWRPGTPWVPLASREILAQAAERRAQAAEI